MCSGFVVAGIGGAIAIGLASSLLVAVRVIGVSYPFAALASRIRILVFNRQVFGCVIGNSLTLLRRVSSVISDLQCFIEFDFSLEAVFAKQGQQTIRHEIVGEVNGPQLVHDTIACPTSLFAAFFNRQ